MNSNCFATMILCLVLVTTSTLALSQSLPPNQPANPSPSNNGGSPTVNPNLCATVSDPNNGTVNVRYYGRAKSAGGSSLQKFTIILIPDTQYYSEVTSGGGSSSTGGLIAMFNAQTNWIAANRASRNIVYVGHLGDCVQNGDNAPGTPDNAEWVKASNAIATIENPVLTGLPQGIPFGISVGNHDQTPIGTPTGTTTFYNQYFGVSHFAGRSYYGGHNGANNDNHYQLFSASGIDFLVISLEYDQTAGFSAAGGTLDWVEGLVQTHSNRKVMIMTHFGINETGSPKPSFGTQGQAIYNRLRQYSNFLLFACGHIHQSDGEARRSDTFNGNTLHTILSDYQGRPNGGNGFLRIMEFDPALNKISVKTYSPYANVFETDADSQFELDINLNSNPFALTGSINNATSGSSQCASWAGLNNSTEYEWFADVSDADNTTRGPLWSFTTPAGGALPITLLDFFATIENKKVKINWSTATEKDNDHFEIQRSIDGNNFNTIGSKPGKGNSTIIQHYLFLDDQPLKGVSYYRLKQVDIDGKSTYSKVIKINNDQLEQRVIISPNPDKSGMVTIAFNGGNNSKTDIQISGIDGKIYFTRSYSVANNITIDHNLRPGSYILKVTTNNFSENQKLIIR